jgi:S1-C subfamily serine protease
MSGRVVQRLSVVLLLLVVVFGSVAVYYSVGLTAETRKVAALQQVANELQNRIGQLEQRLSALDASTRNVSVLGFNPVVIYDSANESVVTVQGSKIVPVLTIFGPQQSIESVIGSGFVVNYANAHYVLTNFHVIDGVVSVTVTFWNGDAYSGKVIGGDALSDLAVISSKLRQLICTPLTSPHPRHSRWERR